MRYIVVLVTLCVFSVAAGAVTTGVDFLKLSVGARATGMGESCTGLYTDVTASCWNPAGMAQLPRPELGFMHSDAVADASLEFIGFAYPTRYGVFGISGVAHIIKPVPVTLGDGTVLGDLNWMDSAVSVSYARAVNSMLSCGIGGKIIQRRESNPIFGSSEGTAFSVDAGVICRTPVKGLQAGAAVLNTGSDLRMSGEVKSDVLPRTTRIGVAYERPLDDRITLILASDLHRILDGGWYSGFGLEAGLGKTVFLRTGYSRKEGNIEGISYGIGIKRGNFRVDYSNVPASELVGYTRNNKLELHIQF
jgi:hypothetical protein